MVDRESRVDLKILEQLPWLVGCYTGIDTQLLTGLMLQTAVIKESLRITALVTSRLPLVSPVEPLRYGNWEIPPGVTCSPRQL